MATGRNRSGESKRKAIVRWAQSQLGRNDKDDYEYVLKVYVQRSIWLPWCSKFVSAVLEKTKNVPKGWKSDDGDRCETTSDILAWAKKNRRLRKIPRPGDIAVFTRHTAIVESVSENGEFTTIDGGLYLSPKSSTRGVVRTRHSLKRKWFYETPEMRLSFNENLRRGNIAVGSKKRLIGFARVVN